MEESKNNPRLDALMKLLELQDEKDEAVEFNEELQKAGQMTQLSNLFKPTFNTGVTAKSRQMGRSMAQQKQPTAQLGTFMKPGQIVVAIKRDMQDIDAINYYLGEFVELKNNIVTIKLRSGQLRYIFNSEQYKWAIQPLKEYPTFSDPDHVS